MKKKSLKIAAGFSFLVLLGCNNAQNEPKKEIDMNNEIDKVSYSLGLNVAENVKKQGLKEINADAVAQAFKDVYAGDSTKISLEEAGKTLNDYFQKLQQTQMDASKGEGEKFLEENKTKEGVVTLPSGLQYKVIVEGTGEKPGPTDVVKVHYHGTLIDGTVFDSSVERGEPISFPLNGVIPGWTEGLQLMPTGSKYILYVPSHLAYGERGAGQMIGPNTTLIFEVELLEIEK